MQFLAGAEPPKMSILPQFSSRMRSYNRVARLNDNFEEICRIGNVCFQGGRKFLKTEWPKFNHLGIFHSPILEESAQQSQILQYGFSINLTNLYWFYLLASGTPRSSV